MFRSRRAAEGLNPAGRFWRPARSQIAAQVPRIVNSDNRPLSARKPGERSEDGGRGVRAPVWNRTSISCSSGRRHHQIGFESIIVAGRPGLVSARPRASSTIWLSKIIPGRRRSCCRGSDGFCNSGRRFPFTVRQSFAVPRDRGERCRAEMKKAAEVDFTWAAFAGTYEKEGSSCDRLPGAR